MSDKIQKNDNENASNNQNKLDANKKPSFKELKNTNKFIQLGVATPSSAGAKPPIENKQKHLPPIITKQGQQAKHTTAQSNWSYKSPQSNWSYKSPQSNWSYKSPQSDWSYKSPQSDWSYKSPQSDWSYKSPQSDWSYKSPQTHREEEEKEKVNISMSSKPSNDDKKVTLSHGFMMLTSEGSFGDDDYTVKKPHWPGANSGVTIGFGFDIGAGFPLGAAGQTQAKNVMIEAGIDSGTAGVLSKYVGIRGEAAKEPATKLRKQGISISNSQALKLLNASYQTFNKAVHNYAKIDSNQIHPALEQVFTYFAYARWDFDRAKTIYAQAKGKPALEQFTIASNIIGEEFNKTGSELLHLVRNYLNAIKGHLQNGKEVEISKEVMSIQQLLESDTFSMMDKTTKGVGKRVNKGSVSRAILTGQTYNPTPQNQQKVIQHIKPNKLTNTPLTQSDQGFSVGASNGVYTADLINCTKDVQKIQNQLLAVGLLSKTDYSKEFPKTPKEPIIKPNYSNIKPLKPQGVAEVETPNNSILQQEEKQKEQQKQQLLKQTREELLNWLQKLSDKEVRAIAEKPSLNTPFAELALQSGIGGITTKSEMVAKLFELRGLGIQPIASKGVASIEQPKSPELPYIHYMSEFEQRAMALYGKVPTGAKISVADLSETIKAIRIFQQEIVRMPNPDGRIDANGSTLSQLMSANKESVIKGRADYQAHLQKLAEEEKRRKEEEIKRKEEEARKKSKKTVVEKKPDPRQQVDKIYKEHLLKATSLKQLAHQLIPYAGKAAPSIIKIYDEINWALRDNFAYDMCAHLSDAQLLKFHKDLLTRMRDEFEESMFFKSAMKDQKARLDKLLKVQAINEKKKKAAAKKKKRINPDFSLKGIKKALGLKGYKFYEDEGKVNLIAVRMDDTYDNKFSDKLFVIQNIKGKFKMIEIPWTTTAGTLAHGGTLDPLGAKETGTGVAGTATVLENQYEDVYTFVDSKNYQKLWLKYPYLYQTGNMDYYRDNDKDSKIDRGKVYTGNYGTNSHRMSNNGVKSTQVNAPGVPWSQGCQGAPEPEFKKLLPFFRTHVQKGHKKITYTLLKYSDFID